MPPEAFDCGGSHPPLFGFVMEKRRYPLATRRPVKKSYSWELWIKNHSSPEPAAHATLLSHFCARTYVKRYHLSISNPQFPSKNHRTNTITFFSGQGTGESTRQRITGKRETGPVAG
jgi:hypothetical protein